MMGMGQKVAPALAAGNAVVVKAPELAPFGMLRFAELALEAGLPAGVLNVVVGDAVAGDALVRHAGIDKISFTGGTATARRIMAAAADHLTPLTLELGGKSANIIFPDADLDTAVSVSAFLGAALLERPGLRAADPLVRARRRLRRGRRQRRCDARRRCPSAIRSIQRSSSARSSAKPRSSGSSA